MEPRRWGWMLEGPVILLSTAESVAVVSLRLAP